MATVLVSSMWQERSTWEKPHYNYFVVIAERLSCLVLRHSAITTNMCATSVTLRNAIKSPVTFLIRVITMSVRSVYVLLLQL